MIRLINDKNRRAVPLAYYPSRGLIGATMEQIISNSDMGAECLVAMQDTYNPSMLVRMTELWVEAQAFGAKIHISENGFPIIKNKVIPDIEDIANCKVPDFNKGHIPVFIQSIQKARKQMPEVLLFAGVTGPFSLCSCLTDGQELMMACYTSPDDVHSFVGTVTDFLINYCNEYKKAGASGIFIAEPSICMLSPHMAEEFSHAYVKKIIGALQTDDFAVIYHNCGDVTPQLENIKELHAAAYHFGDAVNLQKVFDLFPKDVPILGNIHPTKFLQSKGKELVAAVSELKGTFDKYPNFILSSGCDIAPGASIESIKLLCDT